MHTDGEDSVSSNEGGSSVVGSEVEDNSTSCQLIRVNLTRGTVNDVLLPGSEGKFGNR